MRRWIWLAAFCLHLDISCDQTIKDTTSTTVLTPSFKERQVAKIRLDNGLEAYIVSDPLLKSSGAALSVSVGSWNDPVQYPGMAHFLEHMLFMGTEAYPDEAEYSSFIQSHGGAMNAYTASDKTVYSFSIDPDSFEGALDRFSHFFIDPLFSTNSLSRELHNVDQEHAKNVESDGARVYMVFKETSNPNHPNHAFSCGNADTLSDIPTKVMMDFYKKYYSADRMHLVIMDTAPIEQLVSWASSKFSEVPVSKMAVNLPTDSIFSTAQKGALLQIKPIRQTKSLSVIWEINAPYVDDFTSQTTQFLAYLLSSEAPGELADILKEKNYIASLSASSDTFSKTQGILSIDVDVTDLGLEHKNEIFQLYYNYLAFLKNNPKLPELFTQWSSIAKINYQYQDRSEVFNEVTDLAGRLVDEPLSSFPTLGQIPSTFNLEGFNQLIDSLTPASALYVAMTPTAKVSKKETWTGAEYSISPFSSKTLESFSNKDTSVSFAPLMLNPYAPEKFYLSDIDTLSQAYKVLNKGSTSELYYKQSNYYGLPEGYMTLRFSPCLTMSQEDLQAFMYLFVQGTSRKILYDLDAAAYCGLSGRLNYADGKLWLTISGFNDKMADFFKTIISAMSSLKLSETEFTLIKTLYKDALNNTRKDLAFRQGITRFNALFDSTACLPAEVEMALKGWTLSRFNDTCQKLAHNFHIKGVLLGNLTSSFAQTVEQELEIFVSTGKMPINRISKVLEIDQDKGPFIYKKNLETQGSSALLAIEQDSVSPMTKAYTLLLGPAISEQFFDTLRTKQHTGYIAKFFDKEISNQLFYLFAVQSNSHGALELLYRYELFIEDFVNNFEARFSESQFESIRASAIHDLQARNENLQGQGDYDTSIVCLREANFNWNSLLIEALNKATYQDLKSHVVKTLPRTNHKRVGFLMEGKLPENRKLNYTPSTLEGIEHEGTFTAPPLSESEEVAHGYLKNILFQKSP